MELTAIEYVLYRYGVFADSGEEIPDVYTDSTYALNTITSWMFTWAKAGWLNSKKKTPENLDIIKPIYNYWQKGYRIKLHKIKGHAGHKFNELADQIAKGEKIDF
jgi:ribonuclease HI